MRTLFRLLLFIVILCFMKINAEEERSYLDAFLVPFRSIRLLLNEQLEQITNSEENRRNLKRTNRLQRPIPSDMPFPCSLDGARSPNRPQSVHELRPGDVDVIGAMGDSLTAGFGLTATTPLTVTYEERGKQFSIGGEGSWKNYLTLPNILKEFNSKLFGYSLGPSLSIQRASQFNVAEGGAVSKNMPYMVKILVKRIKADKRVNFIKDWKMITVLIGANDFCSEICYYKNPYVVLDYHKKDLLQVLRYLRDHLPRTIVNLIPPPHIDLLTRVEPKPFSCILSNKLSCPCIFGLPNESKRDIYYDIMNQWLKLDLEIANYSEFDKDDFTVVAQPFSINYTLPSIDFFSVDCFHFSQKGNAQVANDLWNNLLEPVGQKSAGGKPLFGNFKCPTEKNPYIFTRRNS